MTTIYRVEYSETHGYFVNTQDNVEKSSYGIWNSVFDNSPGCVPFEHGEGWRESEVEATDRWRRECEESAEAIRLIAVELENIAQGPSPVIPQNRIMKPEMK